jgi:hypothetical protein
MACCPKQCPVLSGTKATPGSGRFCLAAMRHWIQFGSATVTLGCCGFGSPDRQRAGARWQQAFEAKPTLATGDMHLGMASAELCRGRVPCLLEGCHVLTYDHGSAIDVTGGWLRGLTRENARVLWQNADGRNRVHRVALWWFERDGMGQVPRPMGAATGLPPYHGA